MRFEIYASELTLHHHQNPFEKNLCMIGRSTSNWRVTDTVAAYIIDRLPTVIEAGTSMDSDKVKQVEEIQGEPITAYYPYAPNHVVLVDSSWTIDNSVNKGFLKLATNKLNSGKLKIAVLAVTDNDENILARAEPEICDLYIDHIPGKWVRSPQPIAENHPNLFLQHLIALDKTLINEKMLTLTDRFVIGVIFPEEVNWREDKDGWLFLVLQRRRKTG